MSERSLYFACCLLMIGSLSPAAADGVRGEVGFTLDAVLPESGGENVTVSLKEGGTDVGGAVSACVSTNGYLNATVMGQMDAKDVLRRMPLTLDWTVQDDATSITKRQTTAEVPYALAAAYAERVVSTEPVSLVGDLTVTGDFNATTLTVDDLLFNGKQTGASGTLRLAPPSGQAFGLNVGAVDLVSGGNKSFLPFDFDGVKVAQATIGNNGQSTSPRYAVLKTTASEYGFVRIEMRLKKNGVDWLPEYLDLGDYSYDVYYPAALIAILHHTPDGKETPLNAFFSELNDIQWCEGGASMPHSLGFYKRMRPLLGVSVDDSDFEWQLFIPVSPGETIELHTEITRLSFDDNTKKIYVRPSGNLLKSSLASELWFHRISQPKEVKQ